MACIAHSENLVEYVGGISDVEECRQLCNDEKACEYLTYYDITSFPYSEACFLLKNCDDRVCVYWHNLYEPFIYETSILRKSVRTACRNREPATNPAFSPTPEGLMIMCWS